MAKARVSGAASLKRMKVKCDKWNAANPIGSSVMVKLDGQDEPVETTTITAAQIMSCCAVIWVENGGCYHLTHVRAASTNVEKEKASLDLKQKIAPYTLREKEEN